MTFEIVERKSLIVGKFVLLEEWAWKGRHRIDQQEPDEEKAIFYVKRLRDDLTILEDLLGIK